MSTSFLVRDGDLVMVGSGLAVVSGAEKLTQDLQLWVKEIYQADRFHPSFGSTLESMIGQIIDEDALFYIENEVRRVLQNYQNIQLRGIQNNPEHYSDDELLDTIKDITVELNYDQVIVTVTVVTVAGTTVRTRIGVTT